VLNQVSAEVKTCGALYCKGLPAHERGKRVNPDCAGGDMVTLAARSKPATKKHGGIITSTVESPLVLGARALHDRMKLSAQTRGRRRM